jgi:hypothetical protein
MAVAVAGIAVAGCYVLIEQDDPPAREAANAALVVLLSLAAALSPSVRPRLLSAGVCVGAASGLVAIAITGGSIVLSPAGLLAFVASLRSHAQIDEQLDDFARFAALLVVAVVATAAVISAEAVLR